MGLVGTGLELIDIRDEDMLLLLVRPYGRYGVELRPYFSRIDSAGEGSRDDLLVPDKLCAGLGSRLRIFETEGLGSRAFLVGRVRDRVSAGLSFAVRVRP